MARQRRFQRVRSVQGTAVGRARAVELGMPVLDHNKGQLALGARHGRPGAVGHVAHPLGAVPFNDGPFGVAKGLPFTSTDARLYRIRRLTGQHHDQLGKRPILACMGVWLGSRRLDLLPSSSVQLPV